MKTDIASAARMLRIHMEEIARARSLATAVQIAQRAMEIEFEGPKRGHVNVVGMFGANSQEALVSIAFRSDVIQVPVDVAREIAHNILDQASMAEQDGALVLFLRDAGIPDGAIGPLMEKLRSFRARYREDLEGLGLADDETPPPSAKSA